jgi:hypothetical protein
MAIDMPFIALVMESNSPLFVVPHHYSVFLHGPLAHMRHKRGLGGTSWPILSY